MEHLSVCDSKSYNEDKKAFCRKNMVEYYLNIHFVTSKEKY